ncbi:unnamed protein product [Ambrosiozyma monospora]|uniref:Unnamed protein product n=1 Tax=Ambrosiozyma monospora TaxID=43982 RepID=A0ACB5U863_AMBMO|nr:unnamed protein product [Ambrosiozyma monospora]
MDSLIVVSGGDVAAEEDSDNDSLKELTDDEVTILLQLHAARMSQVKTPQRRDNSNIRDVKKEPVDNIPSSLESISEEGNQIVPVMQDAQLVNSSDSKSSSDSLESNFRTMQSCVPDSVVQVSQMVTSFSQVPLKKVLHNRNKDVHTQAGTAATIHKEKDDINPPSQPVTLNSQNDTLENAESNPVVDPANKDCVSESIETCEDESLPEDEQDSQVVGSTNSESLESTSDDDAGKVLQAVAQDAQVIVSDKDSISSGTFLLTRN